MNRNTNISIFPDVRYLKINVTKFQKSGLFIYIRKVLISQYCRLVINMAKQKKGEGFHSAAGLIRYFDAEEKTVLKIDPRLVIAMAVATIVIITSISMLYPI